MSKIKDLTRKIAATLAAAGIGLTVFATGCGAAADNNGKGYVSNEPTSTTQTDDITKEEESVIKTPEVENKTPEEENKTSENGEDFTQVIDEYQESLHEIYLNRVDEVLEAYNVVREHRFANILKESDKIMSGIKDISDDYRNAEERANINPANQINKLNSVNLQVQELKEADRLVVDQADIIVGAINSVEGLIYREAYNNGIDKMMNDYSVKVNYTTEYKGELDLAYNGVGYFALDNGTTISASKNVGSSDISYEISVSNNDSTKVTSAVKNNEHSENDSYSKQDISKNEFNYDYNTANASYKSLFDRLFSTADEEENQRLFYSYSEDTNTFSVNYHAGTFSFTLDKNNELIEFKMESGKNGIDKTVETSTYKFDKSATLEDVKEYFNKMKNEVKVIKENIEAREAEQQMQ